MRKLSYAENKLLKNTDFFNWEVSNNVQEAKIMRRFKIDRREDYVFYNKLSRKVRELARKIKNLEPNDPVRTQYSAKLIEKLYSVGIIATKFSLGDVDRITASSYCQRRLSSIMVKIGMVERIQTAVTYIKHGHVRVGRDIIKDPAFLVTR